MTDRVFPYRTGDSGESPAGTTRPDGAHIIGGSSPEIVGGSTSQTTGYASLYQSFLGVGNSKVTVPRCGIGLPVVVSPEDDHLGGGISIVGQLYTDIGGIAGQVGDRFCPKGGSGGAGGSGKSLGVTPGNRTVRGGGSEAVIISGGHGKPRNLLAIKTFLTRAYGGFRIVP